MTRSEQIRIRRVLSEWEGDETEERTYARLWGMERRVFILSENTYNAQRKRIEPWILGFETVWIETRKGTKAFVIVATNKGINVMLDRMLARYATYRRRQARLKKAPGFYLPEQIEVLWEIQGGRCYFSNDMLGAAFETANYQIDHLWPLAARMFAPSFGTNWPTNLALVTTKVNRMKGATSAAGFLLEVRRSKAFIPRPTKERRRIDELRHDTFREFMVLHCSADEADWIG